MPELSKESLRESFSKKPEEYYNVKLFDELGFKRKQCRICKKFFWSIKERDLCEDSTHTEYSFFREKPKETEYVEFYKKFANFFKKNGHEEVKRYPVVSRWRQDLYFTIASIQDFQRIENGAMSFEYSANPLIVPQMVMRFNDIGNVGITGRHFTSFMMAGQHAFDYPKNGYWRDRTIELNYKFLTDVLGVKKENLVYHEDVWAMGDFSEFGPCLESFSNGLELVNSVFTQFESINGNIRELKGKVVDVGWGMERLIWFYSGFDTAFRSVFFNIIKKLEKRIGTELDSQPFKKFASLASELDVTEKSAKAKESELLKRAGISQEDYEKKIKPMQALYAILDHSRSLLFGISDGALPSNIGGGYNLRVILRRALSFIEEYKFGIKLTEIAEMQAEELKNLYPELKDQIKLFDKIINIEEKRFLRSMENANRIIELTISKNRKLDAKELKVLYESNGITPELISTVAAKKGISIELPESSYEDIIKGDFAAKEKGKRYEINIDNLPATEQLYYQLAESSKSRVLRAEKRYIVLDKTPFYPEGGGQEADHGTINGIRVIDVQKIGNVIIHIIDEEVEGKIRNGMAVKCDVDKERRERLMVHHTSTHLMSAAARNVLGKHAWQEGTRKSFEKAHIDIAHYDKLSDKETRELEDFVNERLSNGIKVSVEYMNRNDAEGRYGFEIYQGHGVPSKSMRMVLINGKNGEFVDAEACGGLHVAGREKSIGIIRIIKTERIHDGVDRIEFVAGQAALDKLRSLQEELEKSKKESNEAISKTREESTKNEERLLEIIAENLKPKSGKVIEEEFDLQKTLLRRLAYSFVNRYPDRLIELKNKEGDVICVRSPKLKEDALKHLKDKYGEKFKGGGSEEVAEGRVK